MPFERVCEAALVVPERLEELGDLWLPLRRTRGRFNLERDLRRRAV